jgi:ribosomal protein L12E/L44/L45/RPP1/RPP2
MRLAEVMERLADKFGVEIEAEKRRPIRDKEFKQILQLEDMAAFLEALESKMATPAPAKTSTRKPKKVEETQPEEEDTTEQTTEQ